MQNGVPFFMELVMNLNATKQVVLNSSKFETQTFSLNLTHNTQAKLLVAPDPLRKKIPQGVMVTANQGDKFKTINGFSWNLEPVTNIPRVTVLFDLGVGTADNCEIVLFWKR